jgi:hypothetical protein
MDRDASVQQGGRMDAPEIVNPGSPKAANLGMPGELLFGDRA